MTLYDSAGRRVEATRKLASGGEGTVYTIGAQPSIVTKLYISPPSEERITKLRAMVAHKTAQLSEYSAWPLDVLSDQPRGLVRGFTMQFVRDHREIHDLYSPKYRAQHFEHAHWGFLVLAAENMCKAFNAIHAQGHVVGDVNNSSVLVSSRATAMLIDCDSFQVSYAGKQYSCDVGVPIYAPPELQGRSFDGLVRTQNHDAFGIAVLVFQLLFMGRHPFSGEHLGKGEMDLTQKIKECRFAYGPGAAFREMRQPPSTPPLEIATMPVAKLFERGFGEQARSGGRPTAAEWVAALRQLRQTLKRCSRQPVHYFAQGLSNCPWCEIERNSSVMLFVVPLSETATLQITINIEFCWRDISAVPILAPPPQKKVARVRASNTKAIRAGAWRRGRIVGAFVLGGGTVLTLFLVQVLSGTAAFWLSVAVLFIAANVGGEKNSQVVLEFRGKVRDAEAKYGELKRTWDAEASERRFTEKLAELDRYRKELPTLAKEREERIAKLEATIRESQLHKYLDHFRIDRERIPGIGPSRAATLESYGIETAADVEMHKALNVHGIGWTYANNLVSWRNAKEAGFVFQPSKGVDPADVRALDAELQQRKDRGESELRAGAATLRSLSESILAARSQLKPRLEAALTEVEVARANLRAL